MNDWELIGFYADVSAHVTGLTAFVVNGCRPVGSLAERDGYWADFAIRRGPVVVNFPAVDTTAAARTAFVELLRACADELEGRPQ